MTKEDYQMGKNIIEELAQYKNTLKELKSKDLYIRIALSSSSGHERTRLNNPNLIGEEDKHRLDSLVRIYIENLLINKIEKLEKELNEL